MMKKIQGQLLPSQKREFNTKAVVSIGGAQQQVKAIQCQNKTVQYEDKYSVSTKQQHNRVSLESALSDSNEVYSTISARGTSTTHLTDQ